MTAIVDLSGKRGLVVGIANDVSIAAACAAAFRAAGADLAGQNIRVHALSTGPISTRAASGIERFDDLIDKVRERTPSRRLVSVEEVGRVAALLASEGGAKLLGSVVYADNGFHTTA